MKKITIITLVLILVLASSFAFAKDDLFYARQALTELGIDNLEIVSVRMTSRGEFCRTLYIIAKTPEGGLVSLKIYRKKSVFWETHPWVLVRVDKIR